MRFRKDKTPKPVDPKLEELRKRDAEREKNPASSRPLDPKQVKYNVLSSENRLGLRFAASLIHEEADEIGSISANVHTEEEIANGISDGYYRIALARLGMAHIGVAQAELTETGEVLTHWFVYPKYRNIGIGAELLSAIGMPKPAPIGVDGPATEHRLEAGAAIA